MPTTTGGTTIATPSFTVGKDQDTALPLRLTEMISGAEAAAYRPRGSTLSFTVAPVVFNGFLVFPLSPSAVYGLQCSLFETSLTLS